MQSLVQWVFLRLSSTVDVKIKDALGSEPIVKAKAKHFIKQDLVPNTSSTAIVKKARGRPKKPPQTLRPGPSRY